MMEIMKNDNDTRQLHDDSEYNSYLESVLVNREEFYDNVSLWEIENRSELTAMFSLTEKYLPIETKFGYDRWVQYKYIVSKYNKDILDSEIEEMLNA